MNAPYYPRPDAEIVPETIAHYLDIAPEAIDWLWRCRAIKPASISRASGRIVGFFRLGDVADAVAAHGKDALNEQFPPTDAAKKQDKP